jgi:hypothetical protein
MPTASPAAPFARAERRLLAILALMQLLLFLIPIVVLGKAIGWPASLRLPANDVLPLIAREAMAVQIGYWAYLLTSVAMIPLAIALRRYAIHKGMGGVLIDTAAILGMAAGVLKTLGIVRWLVAMPALAELHAAASDPASRAMIEVSYVTLNGYAGAVGELLGVQLFSGFWLVLTGVMLLQLRFPVTGIVAVAIGMGFLATCLRTIIPAMGALQGVVVPVALVWFPMLAIAIWRRG